MTQQLHLGLFTPRSSECRIQVNRRWTAAVAVADVLNDTGPFPMDLSEADVCEYVNSFYQLLDFRKANIVSEEPRQIILVSFRNIRQDPLIRHGRLESCHSFDLFDSLEKLAIYCTAVFGLGMIFSSKNLPCICKTF